jgi:hypothetical protein
MLPKADGLAIGVQMDNTKALGIKIGVQKRPVVPPPAMAFWALSRSLFRASEPFRLATITTPMQRHLRKESHAAFLQTDILCVIVRHLAYSIHTFRPPRLSLPPRGLTVHWLLQAGIRRVCQNAQPREGARRDFGTELRATFNGWGLLVAQEHFGRWGYYTCGTSFYTRFPKL